jgi:hypothetical protein
MGQPAQAASNLDALYERYCADRYAVEQEPLPKSQWQVSALVEIIDQLAQIFEEIAKGKGRFSTDWKEHANNTIEAMRALAKAGAARARGRVLGNVEAAIIDAYDEAGA